MDLIIAMVQYLNDEDLEVLYRAIEQWLKVRRNLILYFWT